LKEIGEALPVDHTVRLFEAIIPITDFGARNYSEDQARSDAREFLLSLRKRNLAPSDLGRVSAWIEKRIASELGQDPSGDETLAIARFFAESRVESMTGEPIEGSFDLRTERSSLPTYVIFQYLG
jgi:hypothetical protein